MLAIGLMSGTSMDGIDAALIETDGTAELIRPLGHHRITYSNAFRIALRGAESHAVERNGLLESSAFQPLVTESTQKHAEAVFALLNKTGTPPSKIHVIGYHGQTLLHRPKQRMCINIGNGQLLADLTGIAVVNNFRQADIMAGGQGAPLAPLYHQALVIKNGYHPAAVVNCGGIANITLVYGERPTDVLAFDTGPGNALVDRLVRERTHNREHMDKDGHYGLCGTVNSEALEQLRSQAIRYHDKNYLRTPPPKSLDTHDMVIPALIQTLSIQDACATLEMFTADCIVQSLSLTGLAAPTHWVLAGGGWNNPCILQSLKQCLRQKIGPHVSIHTADILGHHPDALEAELFAWLAVRSLKKYPLSMPKTTGVPKPMTGGELYRPFNAENAAKTL